MKKRILIYGGTRLTPAESDFVTSLTYALLHQPGTVIVTGGFIAKKGRTGDVSTDVSILKGAKKYAAENNIVLSEYLETWLPDVNAETDPDKKDVLRFNEGSITMLEGKSAEARRFLMIKDVDAAITISGLKHTKAILDFALAINKPVLPLYFTGGDSGKFWKNNEATIRQWFEIDDVFARELKESNTEALAETAKNKLIEKIVAAVNKGIAKEIANNQKYKKQQAALGLNDLTVENVNKRPNVFLSYAHEDESLKKRFDKHLTALKRSNRISLWNDEFLAGGNEWNENIKEQLAVADIILLLISADFLASDYIWNVELTIALKKHDEGLAKVIPIFLRPCDYADMPFAKLQGYLTNDRFVTSFPEQEQDHAFYEIVKALRNDINEWINK